MLRMDEIETIAHNVAKAYIEMDLKDELKREENYSLEPSDVAKAYLRVYLETKKVGLEHIHEQKLKEERENPFSPNYVPQSEHPKLMPIDDITQMTR